MIIDRTILNEKDKNGCVANTEIVYLYIWDGIARCEISF